MVKTSPPLSTVIGYRLKEAESVLRARMDAALRPIGLTTPQYACLELLARNPGASNSDLARGAFVTRQTMNTLIRALHERGLIDRAKEAPSGRALPMMLTAEGRRLLNRASGVIDGIEHEMVSALDDQQREELHRSLTLCINALRLPRRETDDRLDVLDSPPDGDAIVSDMAIGEAATHDRSD